MYFFFNKPKIDLSPVLLTWDLNVPSEWKIVGRRTIKREPMTNGSLKTLTTQNPKKGGEIETWQVTVPVYRFMSRELSLKRNVCSEECQ